eukprot:COSAG06_NODE_865_length_11872_cov_1867.177610_4_plen_177_part_00
MREEREQAKVERAEMEAKLESKLAEQKAQMDAKLAEQKAQMDAKLAEQKAQMDAKRIDQQLPALQSRVEAMHAAKLLSDDELFSIEDVIGRSPGSRVRVHWTLTRDPGLRPGHLETATWLAVSPGNGHPGPQWPHVPETAIVGGGVCGKPPLHGSVLIDPFAAHCPYTGIDALPHV